MPKVTMIDFANSIQYPVLFWTSVGNPTGEHHPIGYPDLPFCEERKLETLEGEIDEDGNWGWNGEGNPTDYKGNTITRLEVFPDGAQWTQIIEDYEAGND